MFRSDTWKEIGGIDMTIKLLSNELNLIHANTICVQEFKNIFNAAAINTIISNSNHESDINDSLINPKLIMTEAEQQWEDKLC